MKTLLLASGPDLEGIKSMICRYWYCKPSDIELVTLEGSVFSIYQNGQPMEGFQVVLKKNRYRFEGKL